MLHKALAVVGTRPDAIKMCPVIKELKARRQITCRVLSSGQHREMLADVLSKNGLHADVELAVMRKGQSLAALTERLIASLREAIEKEMPSLIIVHGDTTTSFCAALVGFSLGIPVAHVEAGLRSMDIKNPYPEEMNRRAIALFSELHFAPNRSAEENLLREGIETSKIFVTGNTVYDALKNAFDESFSHPVLERFGNRPFVILTAHRRENRNKLEHILLGVRDALEECGIPAVFPVHPCKETVAAAERVFGNCELVILSEPMSAYEFHNLLARCYIAVTDSGGVQEEAPAFSKPVLVLRDVTEREEELRSGALVLGGTARESVYRALKELIRDGDKYQRAAKAKSRTQTGAAEKIADIVCRYLNYR